MLLWKIDCYSRQEDTFCEEHRLGYHGGWFEIGVFQLQECSHAKKARWLQSRVITAVFFLWCTSCWFKFEMSVKL